MNKLLDRIASVHVYSPMDYIFIILPSETQVKWNTYFSKRINLHGKRKLFREIGGTIRVRQIRGNEFWFVFEIIAERFEKSRLLEM